MTESSRPYHHPDLRAALLDAASAIVDREGHQKLSLRALAAALGVSATAPQAHFANKQALLTALAEQGFRELRRRLMQCDLRGEPVDVVNALAEAYLSFATERPGLFKLMFGADINLDSDAALATAGMDAFNVLREALGLFCAPKTPPEEIEATALIACSVVHGLAHISIDQSISSRLTVTPDQLRQGKMLAEFIVRNL